MSCRDPAVPVRWVSCCSCSRVALPSRDPGTRLQGAAEWCYHSRQAGTPRKGDQPKDWRAGSKPRTGQAGVIFFNSAGTFVFILDFGGFVFEVVCGCVTMVWGLVFLFWGRLWDGLSRTYLSLPLLSIALVFCAPLLLTSHCSSKSRKLAWNNGCGRYQLFSMSRPSFVSVPHRFQEDFPLPPSLFCERN